MVGRPVGTVPGFNCSEATEGEGGDGTLDKIDASITSPKGYAPGTKMTYAGEEDPQKRADILDYLHTLSDNPQPLPAVTDAAPEKALPVSTEPAKKG